MCYGKLVSVKTGLYLGTTTKNGIVYVTLGDVKHAALWQFEMVSPSGGQSISYDYSIKEYNTDRYITALNQNDVLNLILAQNTGVNGFRYKISRSGFGQEDIDNIYITNIGGRLNFSADGESGDEVILEEIRQNDTNQKFKFLYNSKTIAPSQ